MYMYIYIYSILYINIGVLEGDKIKGPFSCSWQVPLCYRLRVPSLAAGRSHYATEGQSMNVKAGACTCCPCFLLSRPSFRAAFREFRVWGFRVQGV